MNRFFLILAFILMQPSAYGQVRSLTQEQLWVGFKQALSQDLMIKHEQERRLKEQKEDELFQKGLDEIKECLNQMHSPKNVRNAKYKISEMKTNMKLTREKDDMLNLFDTLISNYNQQASRFYSIFNGEITEQDYDLFRQMEPSELIPSWIKTLGGILKKHYYDNGLGELSFSDEYVYLNKKVIELKTKFNELESMPSNNRYKMEMYGLLESIIKIESEISEEHKTYHSLK